MGRPSAYKEEYKEQAYKLALLGLTDKEMADIFGVSEVTLNAWKKSKDGFLKSLKEGKSIADAEVAHSLYTRAKGYDHVNTKEVMKDGEPYTLEEHKHVPADPTSMIYWLKNRQPAHWSDKQQIEQTVTETESKELATEIKNKIAQMESDDLKELEGVIDPASKEKDV